MTRQLRLLLFLCMIITGVGLCDLSLAQIDIPTRAATDEAFDPAAPDPGTNGVEIPPDPSQDTSPDSPDAAPDNSDAATEAPTAPPAPTATATNTPVVRASVGGAPSTTAVPPPAPTATLAPLPALPPQRNTLNIILLGSDHRGSASDWRTDTMIVVMVDPASRQAAAISLPRDMWVAIPGRPPNRINTLDEFGGPALVKKVIGASLGIPIDYYVRVDFDGFTKAIDAIGGITINVDCTLRETTWVYPKGPNQMDGRRALFFARSRETTSVYDRMRRQSQVLWAVREKMLTPEMFGRIPALIGALNGFFQTDLPPTTILSLASLARGVKPADIHGLTVDYSMVRHITSPQGWWILQPDFNKIRAAVASAFNARPLTQDMASPSACKS
jgi:polyisoprenyl-teichoic acid--peptidoglycan teichoic acid transferase